MEEIVMDRYTQFKANFPPIKEPRWHDNTFVIQADVRDHNWIVCTYTRPNGERMFPERLYVSGRTAKKYRPFNMQTKAGGPIRVRAVPINEFKILKISDRSLHHI